MRFCICFYGVVGRSIEKTYESIKTNVFDVLAAEGIDYDVYLHNNEVDAVDGVDVDPDSWKVLQPTKSLGEKQELAPIRTERFDEEFSHVFDKFKDGKGAYKRALCEMYSCHKVTELWSDEPDYDCYLYLRPDLLYVHELDVGFIKAQMSRPNWNDTILTGSWDNEANRGLNDRFAFGGRKAALAWGRRFLHVDEFLADVRSPQKYGSIAFDKHFVAEIYTLWVIKAKYGLHNVHARGKNGSNFFGARVRRNGIKPQDSVRI